MEALRSIDEVRLIRLLRRDHRERLFVGTPAVASSPSGAALVHLFALPGVGTTLAHVEGHLEPVRRYADLTGSGLPGLLGMGREEPASLFLALEDPGGLLLNRVLSESPDWARKEGRAWLVSLCQLLARLHSRDLACGRVLPRHLLVDPGGRAILAEPLTITVLHRIHGGIPFQDPGFLRVHPDPGSTPPELVRGDPPAPAGDVFQAGVLLHRLMTGRPPYGEGSTLEIFNRVRSGRRRHPIPAEEGRLAEVAAACLAPSPDDRPTAGELAELLGADVPRARPPDAHESARYSDTFPPLLQLHEGEGTGDAAPTEAVAPEPTEADRDRAIAQLDLLLRRTPSPRTPSRRTLPWLLGLLAVLGVAMLLQLPFCGRDPAPSSRVDPARGGGTHSPSSHRPAPPRPE
ncbi:MAG: protein kinase [Pseudomonadota bacterium]